MKVQHNNRLKVLQVNGEQFGFHDFTRNNEDISIGVYFDSVADAAIYTKCSHGHMSSMLKGKRTNKTNLRYV